MKYKINDIVWGFGTFKDLENNVHPMSMEFIVRSFSNNKYTVSCTAFPNGHTFDYNESELYSTKLECDSIINGLTN